MNSGKKTLLKPFKVMATPVFIYFVLRMPNGNENMEKETRDGSAKSRYRKRDHKGEDAMGITEI